MADDVLGLTGTVINPIRAKGAPGEILVAFRGGSETYVAYADEPIALGESVLVIAVRPGHQVDVVHWPADSVLRTGLLDN